MFSRNSFYSCKEIDIHRASWLLYYYQAGPALFDVKVNNKGDRFECSISQSRVAVRMPGGFMSIDNSSSRSVKSKTFAPELCLDPKFLQKANVLPVQQQRPLKKPMLSCQKTL
ncbi:MAG: hypothetical protein COT74_04110 [Bdellovibrionales bacterium CG10_big_fil_rev_8_21_14_0_10_45_34]|nr:MAG: hypothetical protein COT74_04110 [Bdellovibrionales bacterium CG10_big_fil_rev_8_21_14_0_10_45_34]